MPQPFVTCIMPTADRRPFVAQAIRYFLAQDYPARELVIMDDGADPVRDQVPGDPNIRYSYVSGRQPVGRKRNIACEQARGDLIVHWDDDDWSAPSRLREQVGTLISTGADICGMSRLLLFAPTENRAWEYEYPTGHRPWVYGATLAYTRRHWERHRFPEIKVGEDTRFVWADAGCRIEVVNQPRLVVALVHAHNTSPKRTSDGRYHPKPVSEIESLLGDDFDFYRRLGRPPPGSAPPSPTQFTLTSVNTRRTVDGTSESGMLASNTPAPLRARRALITAALGIGDILRVTPLIRVAHQLGFEVDVAIETDYPETSQLIEGAPEIRRLIQRPSRRHGSLSASWAGLDHEAYDIATFTHWSAPLRSQVRAAKSLQFDRATWLVEGDSRSIERIARELGWKAPLPPPFVRHSSRTFDLPEDTIALHPGCKPDWPWKKWHGFDGLAAQFKNVVVIGSEEDRRVDNTYFHRPFSWPHHVRDFTGKLGLADTAALLRQCRALISNDSGLMHLGVAVGIPTFGIFGITNPGRESSEAPNFHPLTKGLPCEPGCRKGSWGRRNCEKHLECLKALTPDEVYMKVTELLPATNEPRATASPIRMASPLESPEKRETIHVTYYGWVFDASGYGNAARGYLHALHRAGVELSVVDLAGHARQVQDPLIESWVGRKMDTDFHLFHGVPPFWSRQAFPLRNIVAMTVWETESMPPQWRTALNHALEVWLPSDFNTAVFGPALERPVFKLPHALLSESPIAPASSNAVPAWGIREGDLVFYSIFEWQDRKGPRELIEAFLRSFKADSPAVLLVKSNPGAVGVATAMLRDLRQRTSSNARVELRCEAWADAQISALHDRGNCYVSLHHGEGWNLPLFEAACRGRPLIATGYSGPMEFLDARAHSLVRHRPAKVLQRYIYYQPAMRWAVPEIEHASECMQQMLQDSGAAVERSSAHAVVLRERYSLDRIGNNARNRLFQLLRRTNPDKWGRLHTRERQMRLRPPVPIPGSWYDADYFEHGLKSNWAGGYRWSDFSGLFRDTAVFLTGLFPEAGSFLDAGCAKGFLVRALRERGVDCRGFDHSDWALDHAEELARPHLRLLSAESFEADSDHDVLLAFGLFEGLTEEQARAFLGRVRSRTRQALVGIITTTATPGTADSDLAHITLRSRAWWHSLFLDVGWCQNTLHRVAERACQNHELPRRMGWELFVYAPN